MESDRKDRIKPTEWTGTYQLYEFIFKVGINSQLNQAQAKINKPIPKCARRIAIDLGWQFHDKDKVWYISIHPSKRRKEFAKHVNIAIFHLQTAYARWREARRLGYQSPRELKSNEINDDTIFTPSPVKGDGGNEKQEGHVTQWPSYDFHEEADPEQSDNPNFDLEENVEFEISGRNQESDINFDTFVGPSPMLPEDPFHS